jgi:hypothetical protein
MPTPLLFTDCLAVNTLGQLLALTAASTPFHRHEGMLLLVRDGQPRGLWVLKRAYWQAGKIPIWTG